jgi:hypothetical protein
VAYPHLASAKAVKKAFPKGAGWSKVPEPPDVDNANQPNLTFVPAGDFTVVNPLDDPLDMLLPEERRPLHEPPEHVMPEQLHPKIYYVGRGTVAGLMRLPNGTVVRT